MRAVASRRKDRKSTRLNSSHVKISYAVFCLKKKKAERVGEGRKVRILKQIEFPHSIGWIYSLITVHLGFRPNGGDFNIQWLSISFFFNDTATTEIYTLSLHDALPI